VANLDQIDFDHDLVGDACDEDDGNVCTDDLCLLGACLHTPNTAPCDDGNLCTNNDICAAGACTSTPVVCPAPDQCQLAGTCDPSFGWCSYPNVPNDTACNDNDIHTHGDVCTDGYCYGVNPCFVDNGGCGDYSHWACTTEDGYTTTCSDIDECATHTSGCDSTAICTNTVGSFTCACPPGTLDVNGNGTSCMKVLQLAAGNQVTCAVTARGSSTSGKLFCWGNDLSPTGHSNPTQVLINNIPIADWRTIAVGGSPSTWCGIRDPGQAFCWGANNNGQLGRGTTGAGSVSQPGLVGSGSAGWQMVAVGEGHACGIQSGGLYCWGLNSSGQLGLGNNSNQTLPQLVGSNSDWSNVSAGINYTCGVRSGQLYCWGANNLNQLGDGTTNPQTSPELIGSSTDWVRVSAGGNSTCGLRGGALYCWGSNGNGQLGLGNTNNQSSPVQVGSDTDWQNVSVGRLTAQPHACGMRGGSLYCWGNNGFGGLGDGTGTQRTSPVLFGSANDWTTNLACGDWHTCGVQNGKVYCSGLNNIGQLGNGTTSNSLVPVQAGASTSW
jgi:alpha-tubulin suppressor-like RCC1 family protein